MATILVVDDRAINRQFLVTLLAYAGHVVVEASDGVEALAKMRIERPGLVISDIYMPNMSGFELAGQMKADPELAAIPLIFYTATYRVRDAAPLAEKLGVTTVLPKPSEPELILKTVAKALGIDEAHEPPAPPPALPMPAYTDALRAASGVDQKLSTYLLVIQELNLKMAAALTQKKYDVNYTWGLGTHSNKQGGAIMPEMLRWLWRDYPRPDDPKDASNRGLFLATDEHR